MTVKLRNLITFLFIVSLTSCGIQAAPTNTPTITVLPTHTPTPQLTDTPSPTSTNTVVPTNTPVPPTNTPIPPTVTPLPSDTPTASFTDTPTVIPTETPTVAPLPQSKIKAAFEAVGFVFTPKPDNNAYMGKSGLAALELIGDNSASLLVAFPDGDETTRNLSSIYLVGLLKQGIPEWDGGTQWLIDNITQVIYEKETITVKRFGRKVTFSPMGSTGLYLLSIN